MNPTMTPTKTLIAIGLLARVRMLSTAIVNLYQGRRPSAIVWRVRSIVVNAIERVMARASAHVVAESAEALAPAIAHRDASSAVVLERLLARVVAARDHCAPRSVFTGRWATLPSARFAVCDQPRTRLVVSQAATALYFAAAKVRRRHNRLIAAFAAATPRRARAVFRLAFRARDNRQSIELLPRHIHHTHAIHFIRKSAVLLVVLLLPSIASAQNYTIMPSPFQTALDNSGRVISNSCVWTYNAGTTTAATTYADTAGTPNLNPIRSDSAGRFTAYLLAGTNYKFVYETSCVPPAHGTTLRTADNIAGVPASAATVDVTGTAGETISAGLCAYLSDGSGSKTTGQWYKCDSTNAYSSASPIIGLAPSAIISGASGTIRIAGPVSGLSSLAVGSRYWISTTGTLTVSPATLGRSVGVADSATSIVVVPSPAIATPWAVITTTSTGTQNDFAPGLLANTEVRCNNASLLTINGLAAGYDGQHVKLVSIGAGQVDLAHQNAGSSAANRFINYATSGSTSLAAGSGFAEYVYDATTARWRLVSHEQGAWITRTFAAGNFTASAGNWTVASATTDAYWLRGRALMYSASVTGTTSGTPVTLNILIPNSFTSAKNQIVVAYAQDGGTGQGGYAQVTGGAATTIGLQKFNNVAFTAAANTGGFFVIVFEVQ